MTGYAIGIDTGGPCTDAAVVPPTRHAIVANAKALTPRAARPGRRLRPCARRANRLT